MLDLLRVFAICVLTIAQLIRLKLFDSANLAGSMSIIWQISVFICIRQFNPWAIEKYVETGNLLFMLITVFAEASITSIICYILSVRFYLWKEKKNHIEQ